MKDLFNEKSEGMGNGVSEGFGNGVSKQDGWGLIINPSK
jgi:hypothetical protein